MRAVAPTTCVSGSLFSTRLAIAVSYPKECSYIHANKCTYTRSHPRVLLTTFIRLSNVMLTPSGIRTNLGHPSQVNGKQNLPPCLVLVTKSWSLTLVAQPKMFPSQVQRLQVRSRSFQSPFDRKIYGIRTGKESKLHN